MPSYINTLYAEYAQRPTEEGRNELFIACKKYVFPMRKWFKSSEHIDGDRYDDAIVTAFMKVMNHEGNRPEGFGSYFWKIAHNELMTASRKLGRKHQISTVNTLEDHGREMPQPYDIEAIRGKLLHRLGMLSVKDLETLYRVLDEEKWKDAAREMGNPLGTLKSTMNRVRNFVAPLFQEIGQYEGRELEGLSLILPEIRQLIETKERSASYARS